MRDEAECTIILTEEMADAVNAEVDAGKHDTFDDAVAYVITRGFAEIKRARESQRKAADAKKLQTTRDSFAKLIGDDPKLATNPDFLASMAKALGIAIPTLVGNDAKKSA